MKVILWPRSEDWLNFMKIAVLHTVYYYNSELLKVSTHREQHHLAALSRSFLHQTPGSAQVIGFDARHLQLDHSETELCKQETNKKQKNTIFRNVQRYLCEEKMHMTFRCIQCLMSSDWSLNKTHNLLDMTLAKEDMYVCQQSPRSSNCSEKTRDFDVPWWFQLKTLKMGFDPLIPDYR